MFRIYILILIGLVLTPQSAFAVPVEIETRDIVIYKKSDLSVTDLKVKTENISGNIAIVPSSELSKVKAKKVKGEIEAWGYNEKYKVATIPNDAGYENQWALPQIDAPEAWGTTTGSEEVVIAVVDTGFQLTHPDLSGKFVSGYDYVDNDADASLPAGGGERYYHGTLVAGAAAASTNNSIGIAGIDWNAKIMPLRVMDNDGSGYTSDIAAGIDYARTHGADVINLSLGYHPNPGEDPDPVLEAAINNAISAGVTVVAATGNENREVSYPAAFSNVIAVGATNQSDERCDESDWGIGAGSNYGPEVDVVAPGNSIYTTSVSWNGSNYVSGYGSAGGTSLATPIVSGLVGLLEAQNDNTPAENNTLLINGAEKVVGMSGQNFTNYYGYGRINASNSVENIYGGVFDYSKIALNSFRIAMENTATPLDDTDYILADYPAIGEPVSVRATLKNNNNYGVTLKDVRLIGILDSGKAFVVGSTPSLEIAANSYRFVPVASFNITSFRVHSFYIDFNYGGIKRKPYVSPAYSYQKIKAHFPKIRLTVGPKFSPNTLPSNSRVLGAFKLKNYDARPAYLRGSYIRAKIDSSVYEFRGIGTKIIPGQIYVYEGSIVPYKKGSYYSYPWVTYGNGYTAIPTVLTGVSSLGVFRVY